MAIGSIQSPSGFVTKYKTSMKAAKHKIEDCILFSQNLKKSLVTQALQSS